MPLFCSMTVTGSIPVIVCALLWKIRGNSFRISLGLRLLKISMFFYLVPVQLLYYILPWSVVGFWRNPKNSSRPVRTYYSSHELAFQYHNQYIWVPHWMIALFFVWLIVILIFAFIQLTQYHHTQHALLNQSFLEKKSGSCKEPSILTNPDSSTPYCIGLFRSYIIFPEDVYHSGYKDVLYRHEFCHVKNRDSLKKLLCLIIICLHFYNPFAYILMFMYNTLIEYACDTYAVKNMDKTQRKEYAQLLVSLASASNPFPVVWKNGFSNSKSNLKKRITYIMQQEKKTFPKYLYGILTAFCILLAFCSVWLYQPPKMTFFKPEGIISENTFEEFIPAENAEEYFSQFH